MFISHIYIHTLAFTCFSFKFLYIYIYAHIYICYILICVKPRLLEQLEV